jgi:hypothetical protein
MEPVFTYQAVVGSCFRELAATLLESCQEAEGITGYWFALFTLSNLKGPSGFCYFL